MASRFGKDGLQAAACGDGAQCTAQPREFLDTTGSLRFMRRASLPTTVLAVPWWPSLSGLDTATLCRRPIAESS